MSDRLLLRCRDCGEYVTIAHDVPGLAVVTKPGVAEIMDEFFDAHSKEDSIQNKESQFELVTELDERLLE